MGLNQGLSFHKVFLTTLGFTCVSVGDMNIPGTLTCGFSHPSISLKNRFMTLSHNLTSFVNSLTHVNVVMMQLWFISF